MTHVLRNALLADGRTVDVTIADGLIADVSPAGNPLPGGATSDDLGGHLLLPAMAEPHAHIDKALTADAVPNPRGDLAGAIDAWVAAAQRGIFTHEDMVERAAAALARLLASGTTAVRTHVNVGAEIGASHVHAVKEAVARFQGLMDIELVALTHMPMTGPDSAGNRRALDAAIEAGVDLIGGCPHLDPDPVAMIDYALSVSLDSGLPIDLHVDETLDADMLSLRDLARRIQETGFPNRVSASHCVSLSMQTVEMQRAVAAEVAAAGISIIPLPQTNLFLQGWQHPTAMPRGIAPIDELRAAGALVAVGADNVQDPFNPVGRSDALETAALLVVAAHQLPPVAYDLVSNDVRQVMGLPRVTMSVGDPADLVAIAASSIRGAIADASRDRLVFRRGRLVARTVETTTIFR